MSDVFELGSLDNAIAMAVEDRMSALSACDCEPFGLTAVGAEVHETTCSHSLWVQEKYRIIGKVRRAIAGRFVAEVMAREARADRETSTYDQAFIATARTALPQLLDEVETLRAEVENARSVLKTNLRIEKALRAKVERLTTFVEHVLDESNPKVPWPVSGIEARDRLRRVQELAINVYTSSASSSNSSSE